MDRRKPHDKYELTDKESTALHLKGTSCITATATWSSTGKKTRVYAEIAAKALAVKKKRIPSYKLIVNPAIKFISHYLLHFGFLDGRAGFRIARLAAFGTFLKYSKARALCKHHAGLL